METKKCKCCGRELPLTQFNRNGFGLMGTCKECMRKKRIEGRAKKKKERNYEQEIEDAKKMRLSDFTPRDLMLQLKSLGYVGFIDIPQTTYKRIDLSKDF